MEDEYAQGASGLTPRKIRDIDINVFRSPLRRSTAEFLLYLAEMHIEIDIPRPWLTLTFFGGVVGVIVWLQSGGSAQATVASPQALSPVHSAVLESGPSQTNPSAVHDPTNPQMLGSGGDETSASQRIADAAESIRRGRAEQAFLAQREEILRYELDVLERERAAAGTDMTPEMAQQFQESEQRLTSLLHDQKQADDFLRSAFEQLWDAQGRTVGNGSLIANAVVPQLQYWPIEPIRGISAYFHDAAYAKLFAGLKIPMPLHSGFDEPAEENTLVRAVADGTVVKVTDNGYGFDYVELDHGGFTTRYGHVEESLVQEGQAVRAGQPIARSGGRPGSKGAGVSTGPHLHFEVRVNGMAVDPLPYLPPFELPDGSMIPRSSAAFE